MLIRFLIAATLFLNSASAQSDASRPVARALYFLKDEKHRQWCGYASEPRLKAQVQSLGALVVGRVDYKNGHVSDVHLTEADETGDWAVNDEYALDTNGKMQVLKRVINIIPEDVSEEQVFFIEKGKATRQRSGYRDLRTAKPIDRSVDWFEAPPVITALQAFPFSALILTRRQVVWSKGEACIPDSSK